MEEAVFGHGDLRKFRKRIKFYFYAKESQVLAVAELGRFR
jgi:hypothetical protein